MGAFGLILFSAARTREPTHRGHGARTPMGALRDVLRNREARLLIGVFFLEKLGLSLLLTLIPYVTQYLLHEPGRSGGFVAGAVISAAMVYPLWFPLARRFGKRDPWIVSTIIKAAAMGCLLFIEPGDATLLLGLIIVIGGTHGAAMILGPSMKADAIDLDEYRTRERKEGSYFALWNLAEKAATGLAIAVTGAVLQVAGFEANAEQLRSTELALRGLAGGLPLVLHLAAALLLLRFQLGREEHASVRRVIEARRLEAQAAPERAA